MPKAPVNEDYFPTPWKDEIGATRKPLVMQSISKANRKQQSSQRQLWACIASAYAGHAL